MLGKLICWMLGHKRGKKFGSRQLDKLSNNGNGTWATVYQCPRCGAQWTRKVKTKP
jgi:hypothetical protein